MDHCTFASEKAELQDWNTVKFSKGEKKTLKCIVSLCFKYYQCLLQINSQTTIALALHTEYYQSLLQIDSQKYNHKKLPVM